MAGVGDIVEINTQNGLAYAHVTHEHKQYGSLLRVYNRTYSARPDPIAAAVSCDPSFSCFFPLKHAVRRKIVSVVGQADVPPAARYFPTFRTGVPDRSGKVRVWFLWDGSNEWRVGDLTPEQRRLPILGVINDTLLVERIESEWRPQLDTR